MLILGLDLETTGIDVATNQIIEVGAAIWDTEQKKLVKTYSELVRVEAPLTPEVQEVTGISDADLKNWGRDLKSVLEDMCAMAKRCDYIAAHNGRAFDKIVLDRHLDQVGLEIGHDGKWIDTMTDLPYSNQCKTRKLSYIAAEHGFLNPFSHRALFDVLTMIKVISFYELPEILELQKSPLVRVVADVSYEHRDKARDSGFRWDRNEKQWFIEVKQKQLEAMSFPFRVNMELP